jgi:hypothetical protein
MTLTGVFKRIRDWWVDQDLLDGIQKAADEIDRLDLENQQLRFLLSQAPMQTAPVDLFTAQRAVTAYAYVHPDTFETILGRRINAYGGIYPMRQTRWVQTVLMPKGTVIYGPNAMPGSYLSGTITPKPPKVQEVV